MVFQLDLPQGAAAVDLDGAQAEAKAGDGLNLLPAGQPAAQFLAEGIAGKHLLGMGFQLHQRRGGDKAMELEQLRVKRRVDNLQAHLKAAILGFEGVEQAADIGRGQVEVGRHQQQLQLLAIRPLVAFSDLGGWGRGVWIHGDTLLGSGHSHQKWL